MNMVIDTTDKVFKYAALSIPATILFIVPSFTDPINLPKLLALLPFALTSLVLFIFLRSRYQVSKNFRSNQFELGIYSLLGLVMILSAFAGTDNYVRALFGTSGRNNGLIYYLSAILIALILVFVSVGEGELLYLFKLLAFTSVLFGAYSLIQLLNFDPVNWANPYNRVIGTLGNPNFSSSVLAVFSVFWLYLLMRLERKDRFRRLVYLIIAFILAFLSYFTGSIQGLVVLTVGVALVSYVNIREKNSTPILPYLFFISGGVSIILLFTSFLGFGPLGNFLEQYTLKLRASYALFGIKAMFNFPATGVGVDNYISAFRLFRSEEFVRQYGSSLASNNAHSTPVQIGSTFGLTVFLLYCALQLWILYRAILIINRRESTAFSSLLKGISIIWLLIFAQSLLSIEIIGLGIMNWVLGAIIISSPKDFSLVERRVSRAKVGRKITSEGPVWMGAITIAALALGTIPFALIAREDSFFQKVSLVQVTNNESELSIRQNFKNLSNITFFYPDKVDQMLTNLDQAGMGDEIERIVSKLYRVDPSDAYAADLLATYYQYTSQRSNEIIIREKMQKLDPWNPKLELALAKAYLSYGDVIKFKSSVERLKFLDPKGSDYLEALTLVDSSTSGS